MHLEMSIHRMFFLCPMKGMVQYTALGATAITGAVFFAGLTALGLGSLTADKTYHLGCLLGGAEPVVRFQRLLGGQLFWSNRGALAVGILVSAVYL